MNPSGGVLILISNLEESPNYFAKLLEIKDKSNQNLINSTNIDSVCAKKKIYKTESLSVEIKVRISLDKYAKLYTMLYTDEKHYKESEQEDIYFQSNNGRLKLLIFTDEKRGELIHYNRPNIAGPKESKSRLMSIDDPYKIYEFLSKAIKVIGKIRKTRRVYKMKQFIIYLDHVSDLGYFIKMKHILLMRPNTGGITEETLIKSGGKTVDKFMKIFEINENDSIDVAYVDLLKDQK